MRATTRKTLVGKVVSTKNQKTIIVAVDTYKKHPTYQKRFKVTKRFAVHDEQQLASMNDMVSIMETRPLSRTKHFRLVAIKQKAIQGEN